MNISFANKGRLCLMFGMALLQAGCGGGGGSSAGGSGAAVISGIASKGPLNSATIKVYKLAQDGSKGAQLGIDTPTQTDGSYSIDIGSYSGATLVEVSGGTYMDEATHTTLSLTTPLRTAMSNLSGSASVAITPLTEMSVKLAESAGGLTKDNIDTAQNQVQQNVSNGIDIVKTLPADALNTPPGASVAQKEYGILLAAVAVHAENTRIAGNAAKQDVAGAILELSGLAQGNLDPVTLDALRQKLRTGMSQFINGANNGTGVSDESTLGVFANAGGGAAADVPGAASSVMTTLSITSASKVAAKVTGATGYTLLAWNDLGMHCVDGKDYSMFSILPPFNNLHAQLVNKATGRQVTTGVTLSYQAVADVAGSINTYSVGSIKKTNFWDWAAPLYGKLFNLSALPGNTGLTGNTAPSLTPKALVFNAGNNWFEATGIPVTPYDDKGVKNFYPMVSVVARDASNKVLATARTVLPVSDEMSCKTCHASNSVNAAKPGAGWVNASDQEKDWKQNILRLHDEKQLGSVPFVNALAKFGYDSRGLYQTALAGKPILCANCHSSNALPGTGVTGISPLTKAMHSKHATVSDPASGAKLDDSNNRTACYLCHPGSVTKCLRGAMGKATDAAGNMLMGCQSCHGKMSAVGSATRIGWLQEPACQSCHHDGKRETNALDASGNPLIWSDTRFASNAATPAAGFSLYRFSKGHGNLQCEACHGATHAEYPSSHVNDNVLAMDTQGHAGTIAECSSCHSSVPNTLSGGPHGMHTTGSAWVSSHQNQAKSAGSQACTYCHGTNFRGTALSQVKMAKSFSAENKKVNYIAGQAVSCFDCHNGPNGG
jgi:hypothetical protein